jgi:hypothetical protein
VLGLAALTLVIREGFRRGTETKSQRQARPNESGLWLDTLKSLGSVMRWTASRIWQVTAM